MVKKGAYTTNWAMRMTQTVVQNSLYHCVSTLRILLIVCVNGLSNYNIWLLHESLLKVFWLTLVNNLTLF